MASRRTLIDVEDFNRRRGVAALLRGDSLDLEEVPPRPNAAIAAGVIIALLLCGGSVASAYLSGRPPKGWDADGSLVLDKATGARYVADQGVLRPAPSLTSALLAGARETPVLVPHPLIAEAATGAPLAGDDLPERPPSLPATPTGFTGCWDGSSLDVYAGAPDTTGTSATGLLAQAPGGEPFLISGRTGHPISPAAITSLGYSDAQVRPVPAAWLALVPTGTALDLLPAVPVDPARGVPGVGSLGEVVVDASTGRRFLVGDGTLAPFANPTSEALGPAPARELPDAVVAAAPPGPPVGIADAPSTPPVLPDRGVEVVPCVRSSDGLVTLEAAVADAGTAPALPHLLGGAPETQAPDGTGGDGAVPVAWHFPRGEGALLGPSNLDEGGDGPARSTAGIRLVDAGVAHPVEDDGALTALGYAREQTVLLPDGWLALLVRGGSLSSR